MLLLLVEVCYRVSLIFVLLMIVAACRRCGFRDLMECPLSVRHQMNSDLNFMKSFSLFCFQYHRMLPMMRPLKQLVGCAASDGI